MNRTEHHESKWSFPFVEYSPKKRTAKLPLVIQLHGAGERGQGKEQLSLVEVHGFPKLFKDGDYSCNCIFVFPQCPEDSFWAAKVESITAFIEQLKSEYDIDEDRVYLTGLSMGGFGTWYTAMARPDLFAAIAPVCGGGMAWNAGVLNMPVWVFHGAKDTTVSPTQSDEMVERLRALGKDVTYTRIEGVGHNAWEYAYNRELLAWLLSKKRETVAKESGS